MLISKPVVMGLVVKPVGQTLLVFYVLLFLMRRLSLEVTLVVQRIMPLTAMTSLLVNPFVLRVGATLFWYLNGLPFMALHMRLAAIKTQRMLIVTPARHLNPMARMLMCSFLEALRLTLLVKFLRYFFT